MRSGRASCDAISASAICSDRRDQRDGRALAVCGRRGQTLGHPQCSRSAAVARDLPVLVFQHANVRLAPAADNVLVWFIVTPGMHLVHHSRAKPQTDSNYATFLSVWDRLFGTFRPTVVPARVGLDAFDQPPSQTLLGMLATPWR